MAMEGTGEAAARAKRLRERIAARGMTIAAFGRQAGFSRNVTYGVLKGRKLKQIEIDRVDAVLGPDESS